MDHDRKSATSSFYGRKNSMDALNNDYSAQQTSSRAPRDDASSFFNPDRAMDPHGTGGYNGDSYYNTGRSEPLRRGHDEESQFASPDDSWDVYADFNNAGPRYSKAPFGSDGYQALGTPSKNEEDTNPVEMVTVPALGPEWGKGELQDMTKAGKAARRRQARKEYYEQWRRGERGIGGKLCTRKILVIALFCFCIVLGIILAFVIPRVPSASFNGDSPLTAASGDFNSSVSIAFNRNPTNFSFPAYADLRLNTQGSYVPITFSHLYATVTDLSSGYKIATGDLGHYTVPAKSYPTVLLPLTFSYVASDTTDSTWTSWYDACKNKKAQSTSDGSRPTVKFRIELEMHIQGLIGKSSSSAQVTDAACPVELALNAG